jgi:hypothetical protein
MEAETTTTRRSAGTRTAAVVCVSLAGAALAPAVHAELSPSAYEVRSLCAAPAPGYSSCLGLRLTAKQPLSLPGSRTSEGPSGNASEQPAGPEQQAGAQQQAGPEQQAGSQQPEAEPNGRAPQDEGSTQTSTEGAKTNKTEYTKPWAGSYTPAQIASAYDLTDLQPPGPQQTVALVDAFDDPTIEHDLKVFDEQFGLAACTTANGCFTKVKLSGETTGTEQERDGWAQEISTDVEISHGLCPSCKILLVEASSNANSALEQAEAEAERRGATEISNSWGGPTQNMTVSADSAGPFNHPGTVITASSGDDGYLNWYANKSHTLGYANYPAASPHVVAVGGTRLRLTESAGWQEEAVWNGYGASGGGCSSIFTAPAWQQSVAGWSSVGCGSYRAVADVSADADPYTGVAVYDSTPVEEEGAEYSGWVTMGGTSVASPIIAATFALAGGAGTDEDGQTVEYPARTLYENLAMHPAELHETTLGSNGVCSKGEEAGVSKCTPAEEALSCSSMAICLTRRGYNGPAGVGTPDGVAAFTPPTAQGSKGESEKSSGGTGETGGAGESSAGEGSGGEQPTGEGGGGEEEEGGEVEGEGGSGRGTRHGAGGAGGGSGTQVPGLGPGAISAEEQLAAAAANETAPTLSAAVLTKTTRVELARARARVSELQFAFTLNRATHVHVTLAMLVESHGHGRWQTLAGSLTIAAGKGRDQASLNAHHTLARGSYRLTLAPGDGKPRSLLFSFS